MWKYTLRTLTIGGSICVRLTSCLTGLDKTEQVKLFLFNISKAAESKQNKQEVSCTEILPPYGKYSLIYLSPVIDVFFAEEALLDSCWALAADGNVAAGQEKDIPFLIGADDALVQTLFVVVDAADAVRWLGHVWH